MKLLSRSITAVALALTVLGTGCVSDPPPPEDIRAQALGAANVDNPDRPWKAGATADAVQDDWLHSFQDPTLDALVSEALTNNPDLRVAAARMEQAGQYLVAAGAGLKPTLGIAGTGGAKAGGGSDPSSALQGVVIAASWELDLWGRVRYARNAARETYVSAQSDYEFARQSLAATTAKAWFTAAQLSAQAKIAAQMVGAAKQLEGFAATRERVGVGTDAETAVARATTSTIEDSLQQLELARTQALRALELLVGRYPAGEVAARTELLPMPPPTPAGLPLQMLERRPDVIAAERRVAAAFDRVGEAKAARLPQITLNANFGAYDSDILQLRQDFENPVGGIGARLLAPLYMGGALNAQVQIRTLQQKEALADYARVALRALGDVENALAASQSLATRVQLLTQAATQQQRALELTQTRFRVGRADSRAVEQQRIDAQNAQINLLAVRTEELTQRVNLHLALGGSFEVPQTSADATK